MLSRKNVLISRQLASMVSLGMPLEESLDMLQKTSPWRDVQDVLGEIAGRVRKGESLSQAVASHDGLFPKFWQHLVQIGERSGHLPQMLRLAAQMSEQVLQIRKSVMRALVRPGIIMALALVNLLIVGILIQPILFQLEAETSSHYRAFERYLPGTVRGLHWDVLIQSIALLLTLLMFFAFGFVAFLGWGRGNRFLDRLGLNATFWGSILRQSHASIIGRTLASLLEAGVPLPESLGLCAEMTPNACVRDSLLLAQREVNRGESLGQALKVYPVFSEWFHWAVDSLEQMGALPTRLSVLAEQLEQRTKLAIVLFHSVLSPVLVVTVWLAAIAILYAPFFRVARVLGFFTVSGVIR